VKTIRPNNSDPIPVMPQPPHHMGKIIIRFVALLVAAVVLLAFAWSR
jgi:hypothetical protein